MVHDHLTRGHRAHRELHGDTGPDRTFFSEDGEFAGRCRRNLYRVGVIPSVRVYHATGAAANARFGYLDQCQAKYADGPEYAGLRDIAVDAMDRAVNEE